jgi:hypothetical protein
MLTGKTKGNIIIYFTVQKCLREEPHRYTALLL